MHDRLAARAALLLAPMLAFAQIAAGAPQDLRADLARSLSALETRGITASLLFAPVGTTDLSAQTDDAVVGIQIDAGRLPASVTKLFTAGAALDVLGPRHTFPTRILTTQPIDATGTMPGDLIVVGSGDPFLVSERLWLLANELRLRGLKRVTGRLVVDGTLWKVQDVDGGGGTNRAYAALPSPLAVNFNTLSFRISPGAGAGSPALVQVDPLDIPYVRIVNQLRTGPPGSAAAWSLNLSQTPAATNPTVSSRMLGTEPIEIATFSGSVPAQQEPLSAYRRVHDPLAHSAILLGAFLADVGIQIEGATVLGPAPSGARELLEFDSRPVEELIESMNRFSNNFIANQLALAVAQANRDSLTFSGAEPLRAAGKALEQWSESRLGEKISLADGSGLSLENRISARALVRLLQVMWGDLSLHTEFSGSLPAPGEEGTLRRRLPGSSVSVRAKTGTLGDTGVSALAGYLQVEGRPVVAFAILLQSTREPVGVLMDLQERWIDLYAR